MYLECILLHLFLKNFYNFIMTLNSRFVNAAFEFYFQLHTTNKFALFFVLIAQI